MQLGKYISSNNYVESLYAYNASCNTISYAIRNMGQGIQNVKDFFDKDVLKTISNSEYNNAVPIPRKTSKSGIYPFVGRKSVYTFCLVNKNSNSTATDGAIIINFSADWLYKTIKDIDKSSESTTFIVDSNGVVASDNIAFPFLSDISGNKFMKYIQTSTKESGYFITLINGTKSFVTFVTSSKLGWKFIKITPYASIVSGLNKIRITSLILYIFIMLVGIIVSVMLSKKLFKPYSSMHDRLINVESKSRTSFYYYKQEFLQGFLSNSDLFSYNVILKKFKEFDIKLSESKPLTILLFKIDHHSDFCNKNNFNDRSLLKFGITNIVSEMCSKYCENETVVSNSDHIVLIANTDNIEVTEKIGNESQEMVLNLLAISCSVVISSPETTPEYLSQLYTEVLEASYFRLFKGHGCIIHSNELASIKKTDYIYPEPKVKQLLESLMFGKIEYSKKIYVDITYDLMGYSYNTVFQAFIKLAMDISNTTGVLEKNNNFSSKSNINTIISEFSSFETIEEINNIFFYAFDEIAI